MSVKSHRLGPGRLTFGDTGSEVNFGVGLRECTVKNSVKEGDPIPVLSGDELDEGDEETYTVGGKLLQSYDLSSFLVWAHVNAGTVVPFYFRPDSDKALAVKGSVKVRRIDIGGTVKDRNTSDFEFPGRGGMYDLVNADSADAVIDAYTAGTAPAVPTTDPDQWD